VVKRLLPVVALWLTACSGGAPQPAASEDACAASPLPPAPGAGCVREAIGRVVDGDGAPLPEVLVTVCGAVCFTPAENAGTAADGSYRVEIGARISLGDYAQSLHGRPNRVSLYRPLPSALDGERLVLPDAVLLDLPPSGPALIPKGNGAPAQRSTSGDVTLIVEEGTELRLDVEDIALGALGTQLRVRSLDAAERQRVFPELGTVAALYALMPFEASFRRLASGDDGVASVEIANSAGLPAGRRVELLALGTYLFSEWITPGRFERVATGAVSADGARIELDPGAGIAHLTWIAVKELP
jgi:hypothetical protein